MSLFGLSVPWHKLPTRLGIVRLFRIRDRLRRENLHDAGAVASTPPPAPGALTDRLLRCRSDDGRFNDIGQPHMGRAGTRFGRNVPLTAVGVDEARLLQPNPRTISLALMTRNEFQPARTLNILAACWIQFMVHDWFSHGHNDKNRTVEVPLNGDDPWPQALRPMTIRRTALDETRTSASDPNVPTFINTETHWWDASQMYGSDQATQALVRSGVDGKLTLGADGLLPLDANGIDIAAVNGNWWVGLSLMHTLFTREHNAVCDRFKALHPTWSDDDLFDHARLVIAALLAKIHTIEWTPGILAHATIKFAMNGIWYGLAAEIFDHLGRIGQDTLTGIPGSDTDHFAAPYSMTEEFVTVYRMHPLMPDDFTFQSLQPGGPQRQKTLRELAGSLARPVVTDIGLPDLFYSFGIANPGAITLHNYPRSLQFLEREDGPTIDLAAVDILRDRERGVPRYNAFRRLLDLPPVNTFEELTEDPAWAQQIREVYNNDIESVDTMVGMFAEKPPEGFGFSETAFRIFLLMAGRRLKSDRFFTTHYRPEVYTQEGLDWIEQSSMSDILLRHFPSLKPALEGVENPFAPWKKVS